MVFFFHTYLGTTSDVWLAVDAIHEERRQKLEALEIVNCPLHTLFIQMCHAASCLIHKRKIVLVFVRGISAFVRIPVCPFGQWIRNFVFVRLDPKGFIRKRNIFFSFDFETRRQQIIPSYLASDTLYCFPILRPFVCVWLHPCYVEITSEIKTKWCDDDGKWQRKAENCESKTPSSTEMSVQTRSLTNFIVWSVTHERVSVEIKFTDTEYLLWMSPLNWNCFGITYLYLWTGISNQNQMCRTFCRPHGRCRRSVNP